jgi:hypothetical protein
MHVASFTSFATPISTPKRCTMANDAVPHAQQQFAIASLKSPNCI